MEAAFAFQSKKSRVFFLHPFFPFFRGVRVTDGKIALIPQRVIAQAVILQITEDLTVIPVDDRQELAYPTLHRQHRQMGTAAAAERDGD